MQQESADETPTAAGSYRGTSLNNLYGSRAGGRTWHLSVLHSVKLWTEGWSEQMFSKDHEVPIQESGNNSRLTWRVE
jgi:hypothetical protein